MCGDVRGELAEQIKRDCIVWAVGRAEVEEIDTLNIYHAGLLAMRRAVEGLASQPDFILVDARRIPHVPTPQRGIIKGDVQLFLNGNVPPDSARALEQRLR